MTAFTSILALLAALAALLLISRLCAIKNTSDRLLSEYSRLLAEARDMRRRELSDEDETFDSPPRSAPRQDE